MIRIILPALLVTAACAQTAAPAGMHERANLRNQRYCEILVVNRQFLSAKAKVYNTVGLNNCPADQWAALNVNQLKKEKNASAIILNGPRYFVMDRNALRSPGGVEKFGGLEMRLLAQVEIKDMSKRVPYTENTVDRQSQYVYEAGKYVYELLAPGGKTYIMQSYSVEIEKHLNEAELILLGSELKLPKGWQYRARVLDKEMVVRNPGTQAHVLQDNLQNSYQRLE